MLDCHGQHGQEAPWAERATFQPTGEDGNFRCAGVQDFREGKQAATIRVGCAGKHDGEAGHKEGGAGGRPFGRIEPARGTKSQ
jgi:hypothetical protein